MAEQVRIAVVGPFSGARSAWGELLRRSARQFTEPSLVWEFHDDRGDAEWGVLRAGDVTDDGGYAAAIGHFNSAGAEGALPLYRRAGLPAVLPLATRPGLLAGSGGGALRWCPDDLGQLRAIAAAAAGHGLARLLVGHDDSDYGRHLAALFTALPAPPLALSALPSPWKPRAGDAVAVCGTHVGVAGVVRGLRRAGFDGRLFATDDCSVGEFAELVGTAGRDVHVTRLAGGPERRVEAAFTALAGALSGDPAARGERLLARIRAHADAAFTADGELDVSPGTDAGHGWEIRPVRPARPGTRGTGGAPAEVVFFDVAVVGAGVVGSAVAAATAAAGARTALIDAGPAVPSATHWSGGIVRAYDPDPEMRALAVRSHQLLWGRSSGHARRYGFRRTGSLVLLGPGDLPEAVRGVVELQAGGIEAELLTVEDIADRWPQLAAEHAAGAVWEPGGGCADPRLTTSEYRRQALATGAQVLDDARVFALEPHPLGALVRLDGSSVLAHSVVVAAGSGTPALLAERLPAGAGTAEPVTRRIRYGYFDRGGRALPALVDLVTGVWGRPMPEEPGAGTLLVGRPVDEWGVPPGGGTQLTPEQVEYVRDGASTVWPWLREARCLGGRHGTDLYRKDGPLLGVVPGEPWTVVAACWSGGGFKTAPAAAESAAEKVLANLRRQGRISA
ncbi:FAD-dependent oxidoreductase [Streptomyces xanthochromogenes]|uniref:FAD-dependent oxidoreductase n=1 Tax=Streptomyces xanthochromogenes TaxID=67384 RepID=UPI00343D7D6E